MVETMNSTIERLKIDNTDVFLEDFGPGRGKITISDTLGHNYSFYWGSMGSSLKDFIPHTSDCYFAGKLMGSMDEYVIDWKATFSAIRKFIREELNLPWYKYPEFQKDMRERLKEFQSESEDADSADVFVLRFDDVMSSLDFFLIKDRHEAKIIEENFNSIGECWHFIQKQPGPEHMWLCQFHKKLVKALTPTNKPKDSTPGTE